MICAAVAWIMPTPRPYCATAPDSIRSVWIRTREPDSAGSMRNVAGALAEPRPLSSLPCALTRALCLASSTFSNDTLPAKASATGPSRTAILPRKCCGSMISVSAAPGMHGATRRISISTVQACAGDSGTSNELSNSIYRSAYCSNLKALTMIAHYFRRADHLPNPARRGEQVIVLVTLPHELNADRKIIRAAMGRKCDGGRMQRGPDRLHARIAGEFESFRRFAQRARHQQHIQF